MSDEKHTETNQPLSIRVRDDGPLILEGELKLFDGQGNVIPCPPTGKGNVALCRCGDSKIKPFCDGTHRQSGFDSKVRTELA